MPRSPQTSRCSRGSRPVFVPHSFQDGPEPKREDEPLLSDAVHQRAGRRQGNRQSRAQWGLSIDQRNSIGLLFYLFSGWNIPVNSPWTFTQTSVLDAFWRENMVGSFGIALGSLRGSLMFISFFQLPSSPRRSPMQRRRSQARKGLTHQRACVDVSPEPRSQSEKRIQDADGKSMWLVERKREGECWSRDSLKYPDVQVGRGCEAWLIEVFSRQAIWTQLHYRSLIYCHSFKILVQSFFFMHPFHSVAEYLLYARCIVSWSVLGPLKAQLATKLVFMYSRHYFCLFHACLRSSGIPFSAVIYFEYPPGPLMDLT